MENVNDLLDRAEEAIRNSSAVDLWRPSDARVNAEEILAHVLGTAGRKRFEALIARRVAGEPVALIIGETEFMGMTLSVSQGVFLPRNSSELLALQAIKRARSRRSPVVVDVATGTGPVALGIADRVKHAEVYGVDIWGPSLRVARRNAKSLGLANVKFIQSDMLAKLPIPLKKTVDVFTIHPPYVAKNQVKTLPTEIKDYEPVVSLTDNSNDGLGLVRKLVDEAPKWLSRGGWVMVEVSPDLARSVATILRRGGLRDVKSVKDSLGATRVISGRS